MKAAILVFPGANGERDAFLALKASGAEVCYVWHQDADIPEVDLIVLPGGSSYGDYLRCAAIAARSKIMDIVVERAKNGIYVLGICNGFQILVETGLLPGTFIRNRKLKYIGKDINLLIANAKTKFAGHYLKDQVITLPAAHHMGCYYLDEKTTDEYIRKDLIAFYYCGKNGDTDKKYNINGSRRAIAGIYNHNKNVLGIMPHPERAVDKLIGSTDGKHMFDCLVNVLK